METNAPVFGRKPVSSAGTLVLRGAVVVFAAAVLILAIGGRTLALESIHVYQRALSPAAARLGVRCRFTPTCSSYAEAVIARDGVMRGGWKTVKRVARCGPWTAVGTLDPP